MSDERVNEFPVVTLRLTATVRYRAPATEVSQLEDRLRAVIRHAESVGALTDELEATLDGRVDAPPVQVAVHNITEPETDPDQELGPEVRARIWSDDHAISVNFNAARWFANATDQEIAELCADGWCQAESADRVGLFMADYDPRVAKVFTYLEVIREVFSHKRDTGFEVDVSGADALRWLQAHNRPLPSNEE